MNLKKNLNQIMTILTEKYLLIFKKISHKLKNFLNYSKDKVYSYLIKNLIKKKLYLILAQRKLMKL